MRAEVGGHPALPAARSAVALYLGHLASTGRTIATVQQARSAISHLHAAAGIQRADNPTLHPVVSEAVKGWRNRAPAPRQAAALTAATLAWGDVEMWADGTGRLTIQKGKNQVEPATVAVTEATVRALRDIRPGDVDLASPVFGLTGETLANRVRAAARAAGLGDGFTGHSGHIGMARRMVAAGAPNAAVQRQGR